MTVTQMDIVITWVDGSAPDLINKRQHYQIQPCNSAAHETRFASNHEIYYAIASILKYVPFCRKIYIVTDQQRPLHLDGFIQQGLCAVDQIQVIDHQVLFSGYEQYLPTFNSLSIESMLWNIPDLSRHFIYMNDDFFFNTDAKLCDFIQAQKLVLFGHWKTTWAKKFKYQFRRYLEQKMAIQPEAKYSTAQMLSADILGMKRYFAIDHQPHVLDAQIFKRFFSQHPQILQQQIEHRFRHHDQFLPVGFNNHTAIVEDSAILNDPIELAYVKPNQALINFVQQLNNKQIKYGCIQSLDQFTAQNQHIIHTAMQAKFGDYLPYALMNQGHKGCNYSLT